MKKTLTIYLFSLLSLFLTGCEDSFFKAIKNNSISVKAAQRLISKGADMNYEDEEGNTLLHVVGNVEMAEFLLQRDLNIETRNNKGETPLYTAIKRGHYDVALLLSKKGADGFAPANDEIDIPYILVVRLLKEDNLSPEETKLLEELIDRFEADNIHSH